MKGYETLQKVDIEVAEAIKKEGERQNSHIELIASENWVSDAVLEAKQGESMDTTEATEAEEVQE